MALASLLVWLGGCGGAGVEVLCDRAYTATCEHQVECGLAYDFASCDVEVREQFICDFDKTAGDFEACIEAANTPCTELMAESCFEVLCTKALGCVDTEPNDTSGEF